MKIDRKEAEQFVREWFAMADSHASIAALLARVDMDAFCVHFQQDQLNCQEYADWYVNDIRSYFDSEHRVLHMETEIDGAYAVVTNQVRWNGRSWTPPAAKSCGREVDCVIRFTMKKQDDGKIVLLKYESL